MADRIAGFKTPAEAIDYGQICKHFNDHRELEFRDRRQLAADRSILNREFPGQRSLIAKVSDSPVSAPGTFLPFESYDGIKSLVHGSTSWIAFHLLAVLEVLGPRHRVCEIGGGNGDQCFVWMKEAQAQIYCIIDIPESLFFAEVFLRCALPDIEIVYVEMEADLQRVDKEKRQIVLVPADRRDLTSVLEFDLIINTGSLGEMPDEWVAAWGVWLDTQTANAFYSHNYFGHDIAQMFEGRCTLSPQVSDKWSVSYVDGRFPLLTTTAGIRKWASIIFERGLSASSGAMPSMALTRENYIFFLYAMLRETTKVADRIAFAERVHEQLGYWPVEVLHLISKAVKTSPNDAKAFELLASLKRTYDKAYPAGMFGA